MGGKLPTGSLVKYMAVDGTPLDSSWTKKDYEGLRPLSCKRLRNIKDIYVFFYFPEEVILQWSQSFRNTVCSHACLLGSIDSNVFHRRFDCSLPPSVTNLPAETLQKTIHDTEVWRQCHFLLWRLLAFTHQGWQATDHLIGGSVDGPRTVWQVDRTFSANSHKYAKRKRGEELKDKFKFLPPSRQQHCLSLSRTCASVHQLLCIK